jgi:HK97 family phage portal protein
MDRFFIKMFQKREAPIAVRGAVTSTSPADPSNQAPVSGGNYEERIERPRSPQAALTISAVYRAVELRAKTESQFQMQYQKMNGVGGNYVPDMWGVGRNLNYLLQVAPNPLMTASSLFEGIAILRLMLGNAYVYIERDEYGDPSAFWLASYGMYNDATGTYTLTIRKEKGLENIFNVNAQDVLHFPNTFRDDSGIWGKSTLQYAFDTLSLIKTESRQALESAAKGGRVKLLVSEEGSPSMRPIANGLYSPGQVRSYARQLNDDIIDQDVVGMRGMTKAQQISLSAQEMQMMEILNMGVDDVARFFGTPRPLLMADTNSHYTTYQNATMEFLTRTVQPEIVAIEQEFTRKILSKEDFGRRRFHLCEQPLLRLDRESQAKVDEINLRTGVKSPNELRQQYDLPSVPNGDTIYVSTNLAEAGSEKLRGSAPAVKEEGGES